MSLLLPLKQRKEYFKNIFKSRETILPKGSHNSKTEERKTLGDLMKKLKHSEHNSTEIPQILKDMHKEMDLTITFAQFEKQYHDYLRLLDDREDLIEYKNRCFSRLPEVEDLSDKKWNKWGCCNQFIFGKIVVDAINDKHKKNLHPIWGCLLKPTGGIIGPGNKEMFNRCWTHPLSYHACVHDAAGYLYQYHNIGPGYNYLSWTSLIPTRIHYSGQISGIYFWNKVGGGGCSIW